MMVMKKRSLMIKNFHTLKYAAIALMAMVALTFAFSSCTVWSRRATYHQ